MRRQLWRTRGHNYKGFVEACAPGLHEAALALLLRHIEPCSGVLDLGACSGAFLARLRDVGFTDLHAVERRAERVEVPGINAYGLDLNTDFASHFSRRFSVVVSSDVVEHLDSPRHFYRQIHALLEPEGHLLVSTPNIASFKGRIKFLLCGEHCGFGATHYRRMRHISPTTCDQMQLTLQEIGFRLLDWTTAGDFAGPLKRLLRAPLRLIAHITFGPHSLGECLVLLATKTEPDSALRREEVPA